jgi:uncharacterized damage-inducible protein DinB
MINYGPKDLAASFRTVRKNTIRIANDIPAEKYDFSPAKGARSVSEQLRHIAYLNEWHFEFHRTRRISSMKELDMPTLRTSIRGRMTQPLDKAAIVSLLEKRGEEFATWLESLTPAFLNETYTDMQGVSKTRFEHIMSAKEHEMTHRAQLMVIERMLGIVPHLTREGPPPMPVASQA